MTVTVTPLAPFGVEITGASGGDLVTRVAAAECRAALEAHGVVIYRELDIGDDDLVAFSRLLGTVEVAKTGEHRLAVIATITLDPAKTHAVLAGYRQGNFLWHIDGATEQLPQKACP